jgi:hypothetical protein
MFYGDRLATGSDTLVVETTNFPRWQLDDYFYTNQKEPGCTATR